MTTCLFSRFFCGWMSILILVIGATYAGLPKPVIRDKEPRAGHAATSSDDESEYERFYSDETISHPERLAIQRFLLPEDHWTRAELDKIFTRTRAIFDEELFLEAGFTPLLGINKKKIVIAKHPCLEGFIVKTYLDKYPVNKSNDPDWLWLSRRCTLAKRIAKVIEKRHIQNFTVPKKWLYPLPRTPSWPIEEQKRVNALLIEEDMRLLSPAKNKLAWENISNEALDELADIMLYAGGKSYRPDNVWMTANGTFAIIDTEYPHLIPRYFELIPYLTEESGAYWKLMLMSKILIIKN